MGVALAVLMPPFRSPDEITHSKLVASRLNRILHPQEKCAPFADLGMSFLFPFDGQVPHDKVAAISKQPPTCTPYSKMYGGLLTYPGAVVALLLFTSQTSDAAAFFRAFFLGRLLQGLFVGLILWRVATLMIEKRTVGTLVILAFPLVGLAVQESFSITADGVVIGFALMLCAAMTSLDHFRASDVALFAFSGYCASISKPFITPAILPALFAGLVFARQPSQPRAFTVVIKEFLRLFEPRRRPSIPHVMVWLGTAFCAVSTIATLFDFGSVYMRVDPAVQKAFLRAHPMVFFVNLPKSILHLIDNLDVFNGPLGVLDVTISSATVDHFRHLLYAVGVFELTLAIPRLLRTPRGTAGSGKETVDVPGRFWLPNLAACLLVLVGIVTGFYGVIASLYLTWTSPKLLWLQGFQSRYAIPHVLLLLGAFAGFLSASFPPRDQQETDASQSVVSARIAYLIVTAILASLALLFLSGLYFDLQKRYF
jgi:Predicted membrane protein (DUF2142).